jgi:type I restriction enzyme, S subunit
MTKPTKDTTPARTSATPRLRFPEFEGDGGWEERPLKKICEINPPPSGLPDSFIYIDLESVEGGVLNARKRIERKDAPSRAQRLLKNGDVVFQIVRPYQRNNLFVQFDDNETYVASTGYAQLRANESASFLYQVIHTDPFVDRVIKKCTGSSYPAINSSDLADVLLPVPPSEREQQKIADCLTSLDEVIAAQGRKVEALKAHKRGLMQQLFPRDGETLPRLRFPEFEGDGEWEIKPLVEISENLDCERVPITEKDRVKGDIPYYGASGIVDYVRDYLFDEDLLCVSEDGANLVARSYPIAFSISGKAWVNNHAHVLRFDKPATQKMVEDYLNSTDLRDFITGMAMPKLNRAMLDSIPIPLPGPTEQHRIASCLSSLDAQIAAASAKLDALKTHKKGLMQQLFPSPEVS